MRLSPNRMVATLLVGVAAWSVAVMLLPDDVVVVLGAVILLALAAHFWRLG